MTKAATDILVQFVMSMTRLGLGIYTFTKAPVNFDAAGPWTNVENDFSSRVF